ncbi:hypothetical protein CEXT_272041 [Caerostris extrusa]|uniref:Uncharacterized protein n=1 Tax=Caerostris extrusa TaxID=172846 RepID=A0AAV4NYC2_CAEEX|nr:hypothetical protein CEXT_272041 [Caerostris extrusa]
MTGRGWGVNPKIIRKWYKTVTERKICYAASIWAENLTVRKENIINSIQRQFALRITHAYRTSPTSALLTLSGLQPTSLVAQREATLSQLTRLRKM